MAEASYSIAYTLGDLQLHVCAFSGDLEGLKYLVENEGANVNARDDFDCTPLHLAPYSGNIAVLAYLIERVEDVDARDKHGATAFHNAMDVGNIKGGEMLLAHKAELNAQDNDGNNAAHRVARTNYINSAEFLVERNVDLTVLNTKQQTPVDVARENRSKNIRELFEQALREMQRIAPTNSDVPYPPARPRDLRGGLTSIPK